MCWLKFRSHPSHYKKTKGHLCSIILLRPFHCLWQFVSDFMANRLHEPANKFLWRGGLVLSMICFFSKSRVGNTILWCNIYKYYKYYINSITILPTNSLYIVYNLCIMCRRRSKPVRFWPLSLSICIIYSTEIYTHTYNIQVEPGKPGAEVSKKKNYKSKKEFAYRMCTGWPTTAMPKPSFLSERAFSRSMVVMWWPVLMWLVAGGDEVLRLVVRWREVR